MSQASKDTGTTPIQGHIVAAGEIVDLDGPRRDGRDEMNLVEWPFNTLQNEKVVDAVIHKTWQVPDPHNPGKTLTAEWRVAGDPVHGLPKAQDVKVYLVLMQLTREEGWAQEVYFSPTDVLRRLNWDTNGKHYTMLRESLERLKAVNIKARWCFWDKKSGRLREQEGFSILSNYSWDLARGRRAQDALPLCSFTWDKVMHQSMTAGYVMQLDLPFAVSLKLPLSIALYRYLLKKQWSRTGPKKAFRIGLRKLCDHHLGMRDTKAPSTMKRTLLKAHDELIERGFLERVEYLPRRDGKEWNVVYFYADEEAAKKKGTGADKPASAGQGGAYELWSEKKAREASQGPFKSEEDLHRERVIRLLKRLEQEYPEDYAEMYEEAKADLSELARERYAQDPTSILVQKEIEQNMIDVAEIEYSHWLREMKETDAGDD